VGKEIAEKYGFDVPPYKGAEQIVEISTGGDEKL
jgi:NAD(P)H-hydrate epimerase